MRICAFELPQLWHCTRVAKWELAIEISNRNYCQRDCASLMRTVQMIPAQAPVATSGRASVNTARPKRTPAPCSKNNLPGEIKRPIWRCSPGIFLTARSQRLGLVRKASKHQRHSSAPSPSACSSCFVLPTTVVRGDCSRIWTLIGFLVAPRASEWKVMSLTTSETAPSTAQDTNSNSAFGSISHCAWQHAVYEPSEFENLWLKNADQWGHDPCPIQLTMHNIT